VGVRGTPTNPKIHQVFTLNPEEPDFKEIFVVDEG
jgi:hypothetical protein